jgi:hypothetical protein
MFHEDLADHVKMDVLRPMGLMSPGFSFDGVDIVTANSALSHLARFCAGAANRGRLNICLVRNTLFLQNYRRDSVNRDGGYGRSFERTFTKYPDGLEDSACHVRWLRYSFGDGLNCVVGSEVDACYQVEDHHDHALDRTLRHSSGSLAATQPRPPSSAAELKANVKPGRRGRHALWKLYFARTDWLIRAKLGKDGIVGEVTVVRLEERMKAVESEIRHQDPWKKLVALLRWLRDVAREHGGVEGKTTFAVVTLSELPGQPHRQVPLKVYKVPGQREVVSEELIGQYWRPR